MVAEKTKHDIAVFISSCDAYADAWEPFFHFFYKYWKDCPFPVYLSTNSKIFKKENYNIIQVFSGEKTNWSDETKKNLAQIPEKSLIFFCEDYFLTDRVDKEKVETAIELFEKYNADYLRLVPNPPPDCVIKGEKAIGKISNDAPYKTSLQCAIWKKDVLVHLLVSGESAWDFEFNSQKRSAGYNFFSLKKSNFFQNSYPIRYYRKTAIFKGKWKRGAVKMCEKEKIFLDLTYRKRYKLWQENFRFFYNVSPYFLQKIIDYVRFKLLKMKKNDF